MDTPTDLKTIVYRARADYFRHYNSHVISVDNDTIQLLLERFPCNACSHCHPATEKTEEYEAFLQSINSFDPKESAYTAEAFENYLNDPTRETVITLLENLAFCAPPKNPERLVSTLLETYQFEPSYTEIGEYPTNLQLENWNGHVKTYLKQLRRKQEKAERRASVTLSAKAKGYIGAIFQGTSRQTTSPEPEGTENEDELEEGEISEQANFYATKPYTALPGSSDIPTAYGTELHKKIQGARRLYATAAALVRDNDNRKGKNKADDEESDHLVIADDQSDLEQTKKVTPKKQQKQPAVQKPPTPPLAPPTPPPAPPTPPPVPHQQHIEEDEMAHAPYPVFNGSNPRKWIMDLELAFTANGLAADANARKIGIAALNLGPAKMWYGMLAAKPDAWTNDQNPFGFKELFLTKYATEANRAQAAQQAHTRMQLKTESIEDYYSALQERWMECGNQDQIPEWMRMSQFINGLLPAYRIPVLQQAPETLADAVQKANNCYYAMQTTVQYTHSAEPYMETMVAAMQEMNQNIKNMNLQRPPPRQPQFQRKNNFQPRQRQRFTNAKCWYCGNQGHRTDDCAKLREHRKMGKEQEWDRPDRDPRKWGKGQPRH